MVSSDPSNSYTDKLGVLLQIQNPDAYRSIKEFALKCHLA